MEKPCEKTNLLFYSLKALVLIGILGTYVTLAEPAGLETRSMLIETSTNQCSDPSILG